MLSVFGLHYVLNFARKYNNNFFLKVCKYYRQKKPLIFLLHFCLENSLLHWFYVMSFKKVGTVGSSSGSPSFCGMALVAWCGTPAKHRSTVFCSLALTGATLQLLLRWKNNTADKTTNFRCWRKLMEGAPLLWTYLGMLLRK